MLRNTLLASMAAIFALVATPAAAPAREHHPQQYAYAGDNSLIVDNNGNDQNDDDIVSVAEPVYYAPTQNNTVAYGTQYAPLNDAIATPYGYTPQYNNGYYQGYGYSPQYAYNPYYAGAVYGNGDPLTAAVVSTVIAAATNGGHLNGHNLLQSLVGGFLAAQAQQQYQGQGQQYPQSQQYPQQYPQQYQQYTQQPGSIRVYQQQAAPVQYLPGNGGRHGRDGREHGNGDRGNHGRGDGGGH